MHKYIMAIDAGTTSNRCILFDRAGQIVSVAQKEFTQFFPKPGWVEHDANEIWDTVLTVIKEAMSKVSAVPGDIAGIGITNQRETTVVWDKTTGEPVYHAIVWQCRRTSQFCDSLKEKKLQDFFQKKTGLVIDAYFSATKLKWILDNVEGTRERAEKGELLFGTIETWIIWKLTNGRVHVTDYSNASRTMMFNIHTLKWDDEILELLDIPACMLPKPVQNSDNYGLTDSSLFGGEVMIAGAAGDQQAALFGSSCLDKGDVKNTYGTGCFLLMNTGSEPVESKNGLVTTVAWGVDGKVTYALEGSVFVAGAVVQWLRDELQIIKSASETEAIALSVEDSNGVYVVPAFTGLGAPYWNQEARGVICGLTRGAGRAHIVRASLEGIAYEVSDVIDVMKKESGLLLQTVRVDGGASANNFLMQFQADIVDSYVERPVCLETTALGAAFLAGIKVGFFESMEATRSLRQVDRLFKPQMSEDIRQEHLRGWKEAVRRV